MEAVPDNSENHRYLASALQDAGQLDSALESFNRATELNTDNADAHWGRFWVRALRGGLERCAMSLKSSNHAWAALRRPQPIDVASVL